MSVVNLKGTLELTNCLDSDIDAIKKVITDSQLDVTIEEDVIFLDNTFDNSESFAESLAVFVAHKLPIGHEDVKFTVEGITILDKYDIIIRGNKVFIQNYEWVTCELEEYKE